MNSVDTSSLIGQFSWQSGHAVPHLAHGLRHPGRECPSCSHRAHTTITGVASTSAWRSWRLLVVSSDDTKVRCSHTVRRSLHVSCATRPSGAVRNSSSILATVSFKFCSNARRCVGLTVVAWLATDIRSGVLCGDTAAMCVEAMSAFTVCGARHCLHPLVIPTGSSLAHSVHTAFCVP